ncbi:hypothetical protein [Geminocystis herdmanii]|uniref:hypothetical protein n=1 Tax=Geminocystis herdmanii TaxID=669359 RepID=UPI0003466FC3|nr:hypothetical protein [Geminocystis herdmanii]
MFKWKLDTILPFVILVFLGGGIFLIQYKYTQQFLENKNNQVDYVLEEQKLKTALALQKKMPTFGFDNILADWQYLQFIQYFGDGNARTKTGYSAVTDYFEIISDYDPRFVNAYMILSTANSIYAAQPEKTVFLLNKILSNLSPHINPNALFLWIYKGVDEILFLGNMAEAKKSYEKSAEWALARGDEDGKIIANRSLETAKFLANNPDSKKAQVSAWVTVLSSAFDDETRQRAINTIHSLGGKVIISDDGKVEVKLPEKD